MGSHLELQGQINGYHSLVNAGVDPMHAQNLAAVPSSEDLRRELRVVFRQNQTGGFELDDERGAILAGFAIVAATIAVAGFVAPSLNNHSRVDAASNGNGGSDLVGSVVCRTIVNTMNAGPYLKGDLAGSGLRAGIYTDRQAFKSAEGLGQRVTINRKTIVDNSIVFTSSLKAMNDEAEASLHELSNLKLGFGETNLFQVFCNDRDGETKLTIFALSGTGKILFWHQGEWVPVPPAKKVVFSQDYAGLVSLTGGRVDKLYDPDSHTWVDPGSPNVKDGKFGGTRDVISNSCNESSSEVLDPKYGAGRIFCAQSVSGKPIPIFVGRDVVDLLGGKLTEADLQARVAFVEKFTGQSLDAYERIAVPDLGAKKFGNSFNLPQSVYGLFTAIHDSLGWTAELHGNVQGVHELTHAALTIVFPDGRTIEAIPRILNEAFAMRAERLMEISRGDVSVAEYLKIDSAHLRTSEKYDDYVYGIDTNVDNQALLVASAALEKIDNDMRKEGVKDFVRKWVKESVDMARVRGARLNWREMLDVAAQISPTAVKHIGEFSVLKVKADWE